MRTQNRDHLCVNPQSTLTYFLLTLNPDCADMGGNVDLGISAAGVFSVSAGSSRLMTMAYYSCLLFFKHIAFFGVSRTEVGAMIRRWHTVPIRYPCSIRYIDTLASAMLPRNFHQFHCPHLTNKFAYP